MEKGEEVPAVDVLKIPLHPQLLSPSLGKEKDLLRWTLPKHQCAEKLQNSPLYRKTNLKKAHEAFAHVVVRIKAIHRQRTRFRTRSSERTNVKRKLKMSKWGNRVSVLQLVSRGRLVHQCRLYLLPSKKPRRVVQPENRLIPVENASLD